MIDSHAHLTDKQFQPDLDAVLDRARSAGVQRILCPGTTIDNSMSAQKLAQLHPQCHWAAGVHPHDASSWTPESSVVMERLVREAGVMGEIGLDFHYDFSSREDQWRALCDQLAIAERVECPVILHCRNAYDELIEHLAKRSRPGTGVIHCFTGTPDQADAFVKMGYFLSFGGMLTFRNCKAISDVASAISIDSILLETDSPYLAPIPLRGKRNEPSYMTYVYDELARLHHCSLHDVIRACRTNFHRAFQLGPAYPEGSIAYSVRDTLYLNITNRCLNNCRFCIRNLSSFYYGWHLTLTHEPDVNEILDAIGDSSRYKDICFCGFGEPLLRPDTVIQVAGVLKQMGVSTRITTSGHFPENQSIPDLAAQLSAVFDRIEVSIGASSSESYTAICQPQSDRSDCWSRVIQFLRECRMQPHWDVMASVVDYPGVDVEACRTMAAELGVALHVRSCRF